MMGNALQKIVILLVSIFIFNHSYTKITPTVVQDSVQKSSYVLADELDAVQDPSAIAIEEVILDDSQIDTCQEEEAINQLALADMANGAADINGATQSVTAQPITYPWYKADKDLEMLFFGRMVQQTFYGKNITLLNNCNSADHFVWSSYALDCTWDLIYGRKTCGHPLAEVLFSQRQKYVFGNPASISRTTTAEVKILDAPTTPHNHFIPRLFFWIREAWLEFSLPEAVGLDFCGKHTIKVGIFPFSLGWGISLGSAYAIGPGLLGFYSDVAIDQFAPGGKISGELIEDVLLYDFYAAILNNKSAGFSDTGAKIRGQEYGRLACPQRGFGRINYLVAARLFWTAFDDELGKLSFEPYGLYNHDPEQKVQFIADADSKLGTFGLAGYYTSDRWIGAFDSAVNFGRQGVRGWDRNSILMQNRDSMNIFINSHVVDQNNLKIPFVPNGPAQEIIYSSVQSITQNGKVIGVVPGDVGVTPGPVELINAKNRFRDPYENLYRGFMFVADCGYWIRPKELLVAIEGGVASGDSNPNEETIDGDFTGFIGLQELYFGRLVRSAFLLGAAGKLSRPLSIPIGDQAPSRFAPVVTGFTDMVYLGGSLKWQQQDNPRAWFLNPNILVYWKFDPSPKFDPILIKDMTTCANPFLGVETNLFGSCQLYKDLQLFFVWSLFVPGQHFTDIKGKPLDADQQEILERADRTGFSKDRIPNIGDDPAWTFNIGLEYAF